MREFCLCRNEVLHLAGMGDHDRLHWAGVGDELRFELALVLDFALGWCQ